ncbi:hypothetical protein [Ekhidna sp.]
MKQYCLIVLVNFILGCSTQTQEASSDQNTSDTLSSVQPLEIDTIPQTRIQVNLKPVVIPEDNVPQTDSSQILIVPVYNFVPTSEAYVFLNFNEGYSYDSMTMVKSHLDSVVFDDMETRRRRLPMNKAKAFLDLSLLDSISIFNYSHEFKSMARLKRVEYLDANITGGFVAVFDTPGLKEWELYGISGTSDFIEGFKSEYFEDKTLNQAIKEKVNPGNLRAYDVTHVNLHSYGKTLSAYSCGDYIDNHKSYLIETIGDQHEVLFELDDDYTIWDIIPIPIQLNRYPVLLVRLGKPETDFIWYLPVIFDGTKYQLAKEKVVLSNFLDKEEIDSIKCSSDALLQVNENLSNLNKSHINLLLSTFSIECRNNVEYSQWSNGLLFEVLSTNSSDLIELLSKDDNYDIDFIIKEIETPINDKYIPNDLIAEIDSTSADDPIKTRIIKALQVAQSKY